MTETTVNASLSPAELPAGVALHGALLDGYASILTTEALGFVAELQRRFGQTRTDLLRRRVDRQRALDAGARPTFSPETRAIRAGSWCVAEVPEDLRDRTVEITGPVDRKMIINALNSGANVFMADFEDSSAPSWTNMVGGQINLRDAIRRRIDFVHPDSGKLYQLAERTATLFVRPRGWHLDEKHVTVDGEPISASLFDFGLYLFHNAHALIERGTGPYFYLPKLENHLEARLWNDVFGFAQNALDIPLGTIKATVLIETILAAFEMDEILFELRDHSAGLNCGRWDYIFSFVKCFRNDPAFVLPDRGTVGMDRKFLRSYSELLVETCHKRGAHAMGGMAAQIPIKHDPERHAQAMDKVRTDKRREAQTGHDGTWVAHPGLVEIAREELERAGTPAQRLAIRRHADISARDLLTVPDGQATEAGLRHNLNVGIRYLEAWLRGIGCVPLNDLMEDAATAEISRTQIWQWLRHEARLADGRVINSLLLSRVLKEEMASIRQSIGEPAFAASRFELARQLFERLITADELESFLTVRAYEHL